MTKYPVEKILPELKRVLNSEGKAVLKAPTGAGKTTIVPLRLLNEKWLAGNKQIIILQPRRLAARSSAARIASLLGEKLGKTVGYQVRMDSCFSDETRILVITEGILVRKIQSDPALDGVGMVIFDEFHERSLQADLSLALVLQSHEILRPEMRLLIMSATLDTKSVAQLLGKAPVVISKGRSYPVEKIYLPDKVKQPLPAQCAEAAFNVLKKVIREDEGNILVFLPGVREIKQHQELLNRFLLKTGEKRIFAAPLYGALSKEKQDQAILPPELGWRKVVIATNIAETSITIEGITIVIDSGLQRISVFNPHNCMNSMETVFISQDAADQRSGRAGRLNPGKCYRLWHRKQKLDASRTPQINTSDLTQLMLELALWGVVEPRELEWIDPPPPEAVEQAVELLQNLGALDESRKNTIHGEQLLSFGIHPRLAHMMLKGKELGLASQAALLSVLVSERDIFRYPHSLSSDLNLRLGIFKNDNLNSNRINTSRAKYIMKQAEIYLQRLLHQSYTIKEQEIVLEMTGVLLAYAYPDRVAQLRREGERRYLLSNGKGANLHFKDDQFNQSYLVVSSLDDRGNEARIFSSAGITLEQLQTYFPDKLSEEEVIFWDEDKKTVITRLRTSFKALKLQDKPYHDAPDDKICQTLAAGIKESGIYSLPWDKKSKILRQRVNFINQQKNNYSALLRDVNLPDFQDDALSKHLSEWLQPFLKNIFDYKGLNKLDLYQILLGQINWNQKKMLDLLAPEIYQVPSGSKIKIDYFNENGPVLAVKIQELFGLKTHPSILRGKYKLLLHLLSPAMRPVQVTTDLESFWQNTYSMVRKELHGKYKKHYWPEDPLHAIPTRRTKKYMKKKPDPG
jgi:ATP-dependent helicase HrpB